jgi:hypothetical protein
VNLTTKRILKCLKTAGRYGDGDGLYLQVNTPGRGSWLLRYERNGRERAMGLASFPTSVFTRHGPRRRGNCWPMVSIRSTAKKTQRQQQALEAARNITCQKCAELYFDAHAGEWASPRHRQQWTNSLRDYVFPIIGGAASKYRIGTNPARWGGTSNICWRHRRRSAASDIIPPCRVPKSAASSPNCARSKVHLECLILTATRSNEVYEAVWSEIDFEQKM